MFPVWHRHMGNKAIFRYKCIRILWIYIWKIECVRGGLPDECVG